MRIVKADDKHLRRINPLSREFIHSMAIALIGTSVGQFHFRNVLFNRKCNIDKIKEILPDRNYKRYKYCWVGSLGSSFVLYVPFSGRFLILPCTCIECRKIGWFDEHVFKQKFVFCVNTDIKEHLPTSDCISETRIIQKRIMRYTKKGLVFIEDVEKTIGLGIKGDVVGEDAKTYKQIEFV